MVVSSCGLDSFLDYYNGDEKNWVLEKGWCQTRYMPRLANYKGKLAAIPFDFHELIGVLAPRHVLLIAPKKDHNFRADSVDRVVAAARAVFKLYGHPDHLRLEHPDGGHDFPPAMRELAYQLFDKELRSKIQAETIIDLHRLGLPGLNDSWGPISIAVLTPNPFLCQEFFSADSCSLYECSYHHHWNNPTLRISGTPIRFHLIPRTLCPGVVMNSVLKRTIAFLGLLLGLAGTGLQAQAGYVKFDNVSPGHGATGQYNWHFVDGTPSHNAIAGPVGIKYTDVGQSHFTTFCVETQQHISGGSRLLSWHPNLELSIRVPGDRTDHVWEHHDRKFDDQPWRRMLREMWSKWHGGLSGNDAFAAFQFAVWHITGQTLDSNTGHPGSNSNVLALYNQYLDTTQWDSNKKADLAVMHSGLPTTYAFQDQLLELDGGGANLLTIVPALRPSFWHLRASFLASPSVAG